jgi:ribbon-helix-helix CopG family protein
MPLSVRLDTKTETAVNRLARRRNQTRSAVVREAIAALEREQSAAAEHGSGPWSVISHLVGIVDSGGLHLSEETGRRFGAIVRAKARARRSR